MDILSAAIIGEVIATSALKSSEGFTRIAPSAIVIIGYGVTFYFLSLALKTIPVGIAYAIWAHRAGGSYSMAFTWAEARPVGIRWHWSDCGRCSSSQSTV